MSIRRDLPRAETQPAPLLGLACVPSGIPTTERTAHFALVERLFCQEVQERQEIPGGYAFRFSAEAFDDVARFVSNERRCCPFLSFTIEVSPENGTLWLRLAGPEGTRAVLDKELCRSRGNC